MSIELKNVTYTYSPGTAYEIHALKDINLSIPDGQFIGIIGHTGSGKSTLIQHFNALIPSNFWYDHLQWRGYLGERNMIVVPCEARLVSYFSIRSISCLKMM